MADLLLMLAGMGAIVREVPLLLRYDFKRGVSKMRILQTVRRTIRMVLCVIDLVARSLERPRLANERNCLEIRNAQSESWAVVGGGMLGLATAWRLGRTWRSRSP